MGIEKLLEGNQTFVKNDYAENIEYYKALLKGQSPHVMMIGCCDSRVAPEITCHAKPGEIFVHRNISNQVINTDINLMCVLQYAIDFLRVKHIIVCGHYNCGGIEAVLENQTSGLLDHWLENVKDLMERNGTPGLDEMCELNVRLQVRNLALNTIVRRAWSQGHPLFLHGWIYSVSNGLLRDLGVSRNGLENPAERQP